MKPAFKFAVFAVFLFAVTNVILDRRLAGEEVPQKLSQVTLVACISACVFLGALPILLMQMHRGHAMLPTPGQWVWVAAVSGVILLGDLANFHAYNLGGNASTITVIGALSPVFTVIMMILLVGRWPNWHEIAAIPFAAIALYLVSRGSS